MVRAPLTFRQRDVAAAIKAARLAGCTPSRVEIDREGKIVLVIAEAAPSNDDADQALGAYLAKQRRKRANAR